MLKIKWVALTCIFLWAAPSGVSAQDDDDVADVLSQELKAGGDAQKKYFLIGPGKGAKAPATGFGLVVIMPGGDGSAEFNPFIKRIYKNAMPDGYLAVQLVAVKWKNNQQIVWPTEKNPVPAMKFSTEAFVAAVVQDVGKKHKLDSKRIFSFSWSSSGPAAYALSLKKDSPIAGSFIAMSVFNPKFLPPLKAANGHAYFLYHSPDDHTCPYRMAQQAQKDLQKNGAKVEFLNYDGGHGWRGNVFEDIRTGVKWLEENGRGAK